MIKRSQIVPYLDTYLQSFLATGVNTVRKYVDISTCHRLVAYVFLKRHYMRQESRGIVCMYGVLPFSPETIRRAVKDGIEMSVLDLDKWGDKRFKRIKASKLLVESFEDSHVESDG